MNWDTTKLKINTNFISEPLTIIGIERTKVELGNGDWDCYKIKVEENIEYRKNIAAPEEIISKNEFYAFQRTFKNRNDEIQDDNDAFYYFAHQLGRKKQVKIPFVGGWFSQDFTRLVFCLSEEVNNIVQEEKKKWIETGYIKEEDLKFENKDLVDTKYEALRQDTDGKNWVPELSKAEKELIKKAKTVKEINQVRKEITLLRGQKKDDNKTQELNDQIESLKKQLENKNNELQNLQEESAKKISALQRQVSQAEGREKELDKALETSKGKLNMAETERDRRPNMTVSEVQELKDQLTERTSEVSRLAAQIKTLQEQTGKEGGNLAQIQIELDDKKDQLVKLEEEIKKLKKESKELRRKIFGLEEELEEAAEEKEKLLKEKLQVEEELARNKSVLEESEKKRDGLSLEIGKLQDELLNLKMSKSDEKDELVKRNSQLTRDLIDKGELVEKIKLELESANNKSDEIKKQLEGIESQLGQEADEAKKDYAFLLELNKELSEKVNKLKIDFKKSLEGWGEELYYSFLKSLSRLGATESEVLKKYLPNDLETMISQLSLVELEEYRTMNIIEAVSAIVNLEKWLWSSAEVISDSSETRAQNIRSIIVNLNGGRDTLEKSKKKLTEQWEDIIKHKLYLDLLKKEEIDKLLITAQKKATELEQILTFRTRFRSLVGSSTKILSTNIDPYHNKNLTVDQAVTLYNSKISATEVNGGVVNYNGTDYDITDQSKIAALQKAKDSSENLQFSQVVNPSP